ncbi:MAG: hypothetical protein P8X98_04975, partial [Woeseiaceae bacterium]
MVGQAYPADSAYRQLAGPDSVDASAVLRLNFGASAGRWTFDSAYQLLGIRADTLALTPLPADERRLFGLTDVISSDDDSALLQRLDRLWVGYASEKAVARFGRQALSWGNGLAYAPMDLVNPFDPASVDTEYKAGDDMLYLQYLQDNGNDVQAAWVLRRNPDTGDVDSNESTVAAKYHGFAGAAHGRVAADQFDLDLRRPVHAHDPVVVEVALHRAAVLDGDLAVQRGAEAVDDAALHLRPHAQGVDRESPVRRAPHALDPDFAILDPHLRNLGHDAAEGLLDGDAKAVAVRQGPPPAGHGA